MTRIAMKTSPQEDAEAHDREEAASIDPAVGTSLRDQAPAGPPSTAPPYIMHDTEHVSPTDCYGWVTTTATGFDTPHHPLRSQHSDQPPSLRLTRHPRDETCNLDSPLEGVSPSRPLSSHPNPRSTIKYWVATSSTSSDTNLDDAAPNPNEITRTPSTCSDDEQLSMNYEAHNPMLAEDLRGATISRLAEDQERLRYQIENAQQENKDLEEKVKRGAKRAERLESELLSQAEKMQVRGEYMENFEQEKSALKREAQKAPFKADCLLGFLTKAQDELLKVKKEKNMDNKVLTCRAMAQHSTLRKLGDALKAANEGLERLEVKNVQLEMSLHSAVKERTEMQQKILRMEAKRHVEFESELDVIKEHLSLQQQTLGLLQSVQSQLAAKQADYTTVQSESFKLASRLEVALEGQVKAEKQVEEVNAKLVVLEKDANIHQGEYRQLCDTNASLERRSPRLTTEHSILHHKLHTEEIRVNDLKAGINTWMDTATEAQTNEDKLRDLVEGKTAEHEASIQELEAANTTMKKLREELDEVRSQVHRDNLEETGLKTPQEEDLKDRSPLRREARRFKKLQVTEEARFRAHRVNLEETSLETPREDEPEYRAARPREPLRTNYQPKARRLRAEFSPVKGVDSRKNKGYIVELETKLKESQADEKAWASHINDLHKQEKERTESLKAQLNEVVAEKEALEMNIATMRSKIEKFLHTPRSFLN